MITKLISSNNDSDTTLRRLLSRARGVITGLVYHALTPVVLIVISLATLVFEVYTFEHELHVNSSLSVSFLNIGQGDATLIQAPGGQSILIDGGPSNGGVLSEIGASIPFYRRHIDVVIATHPDADHIGGLPKVIERYHPQILFESGVHSETYIDESLSKKVLDNNVRTLRARKGMTIKFGMRNTKLPEPILEILFPDRNVDSWTSKTNDASIVSRLSFGSTSFMFTGDSPINIEHHLYISNMLSRTNVLKAGHHGSRTSTSDEFVKALAPEVAIISVGKKNRYGHPHQEVLDILKNNKVQILRTDEIGSIKIESDGRKIKIID